MAQVYVGHPCPYCGNTGYKPTRRFKPLFWLLVILTCGVFWGYRCALSVVFPRWLAH